MRAWEVGAGTDSQNEPALGQAVKCGDRMRQGDRMPKQRQENCRAERDAFCRAGHSGQKGQRLSTRTRQQRVSDPD